MAMYFHLERERMMKINVLPHLLDLLLHIKYLFFLIRM